MIKCDRCRDVDACDGLQCHNYEVETDEMPITHCGFWSAGTCDNELSEKDGQYVSELHCWYECELYEEV